MALRTAATSGRRFRHLARKKRRRPAYTHRRPGLHKVLALQNERPITTYKVYSRNAMNRQTFC